MRSTAWAVGSGRGGLTQSEPEPQPPAQSRSPWARSSLRSILQREERGEDPHSRPSTCRGLWASEAHSTALPTSTQIVSSILATPLPLKYQKSHLRSELMLRAGEGAQARPGPAPPGPAPPHPLATDRPPPPPPPPPGLLLGCTQRPQETPRLELAVTYGPDCLALQEGRVSRGGRLPLQ